MPRITNQNSAIEEKKVFKVQGTIKDTKETLIIKGKSHQKYNFESTCLPL